MKEKPKKDSKNLVVLTVTIDPDKAIVTGENDQKGIKTYPIKISGANGLLELDQELFEGARDLMIRMLHHYNSLNVDYQYLQNAKQNRDRTKKEISDIKASLKKVSQGEFRNIDFNDDTPF